MRSCWRRLLGKSQRSVHVISDLVLRSTCCDSCSMSIDVATSTFYALRSLRFLRSGYALYALRSGTVKKWAFYASYIIRSTSRSTFYFYVPPREPMDLFPRCREDKVEAGRFAKPVVHVNVSPLVAAIAYSSRVCRRPQVEHILSTGEACHTSYPFACLRSERSCSPIFIRFRHRAPR